MTRILVPVFILFTDVAFGEEAAKTVAEAPSAAASAGWSVLELVLTIVGTPLALLMTALVIKLLNKVGIETSEATESLARSQADRVIDQVEAWAAKKAAKGKKPDSDSKLSKGIKLLDSILGATGAKEKISTSLEHLIEERLMARHNDKNSEMTLKSDPTEEKGD